MNPLKPYELYAGDVSLWCGAKGPTQSQINIAAKKMTLKSGYLWTTLDLRLNEKYVRTVTVTVK